jgi:hypothetical protein
MLEQPFKLLAAQPGILAEYRSFDGPRFAVDAAYEGDNKGTAVRIPVWVKSGLKKEEKKEKGEVKKDEKGKVEEKKDGKNGDTKKKEKATVTVLSMNGDTLRRFKTELDTFFTRSIYWYMDTRGVRFPSKNEPDKEQLEPGGGPQVLPGEYWVKVKYLDYQDSVKVKVMDDPRLSISARDREARNAAVRDLHKTVERAGKAYERLKEAEKTIGLVESQFVNVPDSLKKDVNKLGSALKDSIGVLKDKFFTHKEIKGIQRNPEVLNARFFRALEYITGNQGAPNANAQIAVADAKREADAVVGKVNAFFDTQWKEYRTKVETVQYSLFKDFDRL